MMGFILMQSLPSSTPMRRSLQGIGAYELQRLARKGLTYNHDEVDRIWAM